MHYGAEYPSFSRMGGVTALVFTVLAIFLNGIDFVPEVTVEAQGLSAAKQAQEGEILSQTPVRTIGVHTDTASPVAQEVPAGDTPVRIVLESVGIDTTITSPNNTDVSVLDRALLNGAVQYPTNTMLGEDGNVLLFAHSSYLPVVHNKAYQAFNGLGDVKVGDSVSVFSQTHEFVYTVHEVYRAHADEATIAFDADVPMLTLATCNAFGGKEDRFIVHASLVRVQPNI